MQSFSGPGMLRRALREKTISDKANLTFHFWFLFSFVFRVNFSFRKHNFHGFVLSHSQQRLGTHKKPNYKYGNSKRFLMLNLSHSDIYKCHLPNNFCIHAALYQHTATSLFHSQHYAVAGPHLIQTHSFWSDQSVDFTARSSKHQCPKIVLFFSASVMLWFVVLWKFNVVYLTCLFLIIHKIKCPWLQLQNNTIIAR